MERSVPAGDEALDPRALKRPAVLFTGHPSAGKTTIARALSGSLTSSGVPNEVLDGDELRDRLPPGLGFSKTDRSHQFARALYIAELLASHGVLPILALVAPLASDRRSAARRFSTAGYIEVHLDPPLKACMDRDTHGLYRHLSALGGQSLIDAEIVAIYERPESPSLCLDTDELDIAKATAAVMEIVDQRLGDGSRR